tara:strand:- start:1042 stop:1176 length:135 start_codon:yes stop_codon:yes gene_type:complete
MMNKIKLLIREFEKEKEPFQQLVVLGQIQNQLDEIKRELSRKIR